MINLILLLSSRQELISFQDTSNGGGELGADPGSFWHWSQHDLVTDWVKDYRRAGTHDDDWGSLAWASRARIVEPFIVSGGGGVEEGRARVQHGRRGQ